MQASAHKEHVPYVPMFLGGDSQVFLSLLEGGSL
jgi:hypothetical protein